MPTEPKLIDRAEQPYVSIRKLVTMQTLAEVADELPGLFGRLTGNGVEPSGAPFFKYNVIRMPDLLDVEVGVPVPVGTAAEQQIRAALDGDDRILSGVLPGGRFASVTHVGHPDGLLEATAALLDWGSEQGLRWDMSENDQGQTWGLRLELYKTDPAIEPDLNKWETELVFRLAD
jgi:effector-binding domain-containing protein